MLQESTAAPTGKHIAVLGSYDPHLKTAVLKADKIKEWIGKGAQASASVHNLLVREGVIEGKKKSIKMPKPEVKEAPVEEVNPPASGEEAPAEEAKEEKAE
ncbi:MAG: Plastid ribosomal protein S16 [Candidatus Moranbacteria bacterium GW2011_GWE2_47_10]|nr:MAG: Plastid ribosomal protein S16 [Candidatus Moranbacteria bacterium GW2011_GWE2_47_10]